MTTTARPREIAVTRNGSHRIGAPHFTRLDAIREAFLQVRRVYLHARRAKSARVDCFRRDFACGKVRALENLYDLSAADITDGAPLSAVLRPYEAIMAELTHLAEQREAATAHEPLSLLPLHQRETRAQAALDEAQQAAIAHENDPAALAAVVDSVTRYRVVLDDLVKAVSRKLSRLQGAPKVWA